MLTENLPRGFGPYTLLERLAVGGMAEVYTALSAGVGGFRKPVALKVIHPRYSMDKSFVSMLIDEAKLSVLLNHQNIVQTFDLGCIEDTYFIVMELVDGCDAYHLGKWFAQNGGRLSFDLAAFIALEAARGLDYAHRKTDELGRELGVVHRDISPQNLLLSRSGEVKVADFGIAKAAYRDDDTDAGVIKGKYFYMSPEQAWGDPLDRRSDVFSLGIVLWELLVGTRLRREQQLEALLRAVRAAEVPPPSIARTGVPPALDQVVLRATSLRREERFESAGEMAEALSLYLATRGPAYRSAELAKLVAKAGRPPPMNETASPSIPETRAHASDRTASDGTRFQPGQESVLFHTVDEAGEGRIGSATDIEFDARENVPTLVGRRVQPDRPSVIERRLRPRWLPWLLPVVALAGAALYLVTRGS